MDGHVAEDFDMRQYVRMTDPARPSLRPKGVGVVIVAHHEPMSLRRVRTDQPTTVTSAFHGDGAQS